MSKLRRLIQEYKEYVAIFIKQKKGIFLLGVFITLVIYFNRTVTGYVIVRALGNKTTALNKKLALGRLSLIIWYNTFIYLGGFFKKVFQFSLIISIEK